MTHRTAQQTLVTLSVLVSVVAVGVRCAADDDGTPVWVQNLPGDVVFADHDGDALAIFRVAASGGARARLFKNDDPFDANALYPRWEPDGRRVHFTAMRGGAWAGFAMDADGGHPHPEADRDFRLLSVPTESPDLVVEDGAIFARDANGRRHLLHREAHGAAPINLANVAWGPDRDYVIFQACDAAARCDVRIARADGGGAFSLGPGRHPSWNWAEPGE